MLKMLADQEEREMTELWTEAERIERGKNLRKKFAETQCPSCERKSALFKRRSETGHWENCRHCGYTGHITDG